MKVTGFFEKVFYYMDTIFFVSLLTIAVMGAIFFYLLKIKKVTAKEEKIDYSVFDRSDTIDYVKFDDMISEDADDLSSFGMVEVGNNTFVAGISVVGYKYASASPDEKIRSMVNAISFSYRITGPIQMRQTSKGLDLTHNIAVFEEAKVRAVKEHMALMDEYNDTVKAADNFIDDSEAYAVYEKQILEIKRKVVAKEHEIKEAEAVLRYMDAMTGKKKGAPKNTKKINQIMFSYTFNPSDYQEELTKEEIYEKAFDKLKTMADSYGEGMMSCGYTYRRLSKKELVELMRKHLQPYSGDEGKIEDMLESSLNALLVTCDSLVGLEIEKMDEEKYIKQLEENEKARQEYLQKKRDEIEKVKVTLETEAKERAQEIQQAM